MAKGGPEQIIEDSAVNKAKARGWKSFKVEFIGTRGAPDRLFVRDGSAVFLEFKRRGETPTEQQTKRHSELRAAGLIVEWADNVALAMEILKRHEHGS